ncbi:MAG: tRNA-dihydrouridine synthase family protein [Lachnospiraceae bacterium]|nr:tRNA-dihydrouridine synthase family protein [Lachnospiraceae bacterium]
MKYYMAPLEGITTFPLRNAHRLVFPGTDKYYTPFISTTDDFVLKKRDLRDLLPENNRGAALVPQLLTNSPSAMLRTAAKLAALGYHEINLNLGCPYGTVVAKKRGAGMLRDPGELDRFLEAVFRGLGPASPQISVKTRIGISDPSEAETLIRVFNRYPISELTIHPRFQKELYRGTPHLELFGNMFRESRNPVCYNGDVECPADVQKLTADFPALDAVMIGRGLIRRPSLVRELQGGPPASREELLRYYREVEAATAAVMPDENARMHRMKEFMEYFGPSLAGSDHRLAELLKAPSWSRYKGAMEAILYGS